MTAISSKGAVAELMHYLGGLNSVNGSFDRVLIAGRSSYGSIAPIDAGVVKTAVGWPSRIQSVDQCGRQALIN